jgi:hypothetical protein
MEPRINRPSPKRVDMPKTKFIPKLPIRMENKLSPGEKLLSARSLSSQFEPATLKNKRTSSLPALRPPPREPLYIIAPSPTSKDTSPLLLSYSRKGSRTDRTTSLASPPDDKFPSPALYKMSVGNIKIKLKSHFSNNSLHRHHASETNSTKIIADTTK